MPLQPCFSAVAQPPLPLHEFLVAQPWSPVLQPPVPLQAFRPAQACFAMLLVSIFVLSPRDLQPPMPLQAFRPAQACFAMLLVSIFVLSPRDLQPALVPSRSPPTASARMLAARAGALSLVFLTFTCLPLCSWMDSGMDRASTR